MDKIILWHDLCIYSLYRSVLQKAENSGTDRSAGEVEIMIQILNMLWIVVFFWLVIEFINSRLNRNRRINNISDEFHHGTDK